MRAVKSVLVMAGSLKRA
jgi:dynein heavy chain, axonemal